MKPSTHRDAVNYTVIVGCGRLGSGLANALSDENGNVLVVDRDKDSFRKLSPSYVGLTLTGDATDIDVLREAQLENATAVVAVTNNDNVNIMIAQMARELFKSQRVIVRLYDPERECVYRELGIATICPAALSQKEIRKLLAGDGKETTI